jgi:AraC family transcriptional regulator
MAPKHWADVLQSLEKAHARPPPTSRIILPGVDVIREGRVEPFLDTAPTASSASVQWEGIELRNYSTPPVFISRHEHPEHFLHVVLRELSITKYARKERVCGLLHARGQSFFCPEALWMK